jgi:hypothetical protein
LEEKLNGFKFSNKIHSARGVKLGCGFSPVFNKIVVDSKKVNGRGIRITQYTDVSTLFYADQVLLDETEDDLQAAHKSF